MTDDACQGACQPWCDQRFPRIARALAYVGALCVLAPILVALLALLPCGTMVERILRAVLAVLAGAVVLLATQPF